MTQRVGQEKKERTAPVQVMTYHVVPPGNLFYLFICTGQKPQPIYVPKKEDPKTIDRVTIVGEHFIVHGTP